MAVSFTHTLWLGKDHVLSVQNSNFREEYKRFYFRDIQSLVASRTNRWIILGTVWGLLAILIAGVFFLLDKPLKLEGGGYMMGCIFGFPFVYASLKSLILGPTCRCYLQTAAHKELLASVDRMRKAKKVFAQLRPLIEQEQGVLTLEMISETGPTSD